MDTKLTLANDGKIYEVKPDDIKNWADIMCSYTRSDLGGVVRKFTSKFVFCRKAYKYLQRLYLEQGVEAECTLSVYHFTEEWQYVCDFECQLDFSTIKWDGYILTISAVDNSLSALIKSQKGVKYEFTVGEDIKEDCKFVFDRLPVTESATYEFTDGTSDPETSALNVTLSRGELPLIGNVANELSVGGAILYKDDQTSESDSFIISAYKNVTVKLAWDMLFNDRNSSGAKANILCRQIRGDVTVRYYNLFEVGGNRGSSLDTYSNPSLLPSVTAEDVSKWAVVGSTVWQVVYNGRSYTWVSTGKDIDDFLSRKENGSTDFDMQIGDKLRIEADFLESYSSSTFTVVEGAFIFSWTHIADSCIMPCFLPKQIGKTILEKIAEGKFNIDLNISEQDQRILGTRIIAAESIRGIPNAKLYTSFNEFCDWMSAVFGYVYQIGEPYANPFKAIVDVGGMMIIAPDDVESIAFEGDVITENILYNPTNHKFYYISNGRYYTEWPECGDFITDEGDPRLDVVYRFNNNRLKIFAIENNAYIISDYQYDPCNFNKPFVSVEFMHRSELFIGSAVKTISRINDVNFGIDQSMIYSTIVAGYDKKDYDGVNGRDEFNFSATYSTGSTVSDKKLNLISKYRADCYGMEFTAQKRGKDTTDTKSDQDVFFVGCVIRGGLAYPDRSINVENALSDRIFNGAFSPMDCVKANAGLICAQSEETHLRYASSDGNSDIVIGGKAVTSDIDIDQPIFTCSSIEFTTDDQCIDFDMSDIICVKHEGMTYTGFITNIDIMCFRPEAIKYKLIVKSIVYDN